MRLRLDVPWGRVAVLTAVFRNASSWSQNLRNIHQGLVLASTTTPQVAVESSLLRQKVEKRKLRVVVDKEKVRWLARGL
jgi:hypothetical protein